MLDLDASVNLFFYPVYKQLEVGELKPTKITLQLADRSIKISMVGEIIFQLISLSLKLHQWRILEARFMWSLVDPS